MWFTSARVAARIPFVLAFYTFSMIPLAPSPPPQPVRPQASHSSTHVLVSVHPQRPQSQVVVGPRGVFAVYERHRPVREMSFVSHPTCLDWFAEDSLCAVGDRSGIVHLVDVDRLNVLTEFNAAVRSRIYENCAVQDVSWNRDDPLLVASCYTSPFGDSSSPASASSTSNPTDSSSLGSYFGILVWDRGHNASQFSAARSDVSSSSSVVGSAVEERHRYTAQAGRAVIHHARDRLLSRTPPQCLDWLQSRTLLVGLGRAIRWYDLRVKAGTMRRDSPSFHLDAHRSTIRQISVNPHDPIYYASCDDQILKVWDSRSPENPLVHFLDFDSMKSEMVSEDSNEQRSFVPDLPLSGHSHSHHSISPGSGSSERNRMKYYSRRRVTIDHDDDEGEESPEEEGELLSRADRRRNRKRRKKTRKKPTTTTTTKSTRFLGIKHLVWSPLIPSLLISSSGHSIKCWNTRIIEPEAAHAVSSVFRVSDAKTVVWEPTEEMIQNAIIQDSDNEEEVDGRMTSPLLLSLSPSQTTPLQFLCGFQGGSIGFIHGKRFVPMSLSPHNQLLTSKGQSFTFDSDIVSVMKERAMRGIGLDIETNLEIAVSMKRRYPDVQVWALMKLMKRLIRPQYQFCFVGVLRLLDPRLSIRKIPFELPQEYSSLLNEESSSGNSGHLVDGSDGDKSVVSKSGVIGSGLRRHSSVASTSSSSSRRGRGRSREGLEASASTSSTAATDLDIDSNSSSSSGIDPATESIFPRFRHHRGRSSNSSRLKRVYILAQAGWYEMLLKLHRDTVPSNLCSERSVGILLFNQELSRALNLLSRLASMDPENRSHYEMLRFACVGFQMAPVSERSRFASAHLTIRNTYLRHAFQFLFQKDIGCVLQSRNIPLQDRVSFACLYLSDKKLVEYLNRQAARLVREGVIEAILLTGLSPNQGLPLIQNYVQRTGDIQLACLVFAHAINKENRRRWSYVIRLLAEYRSLLDRWKLWTHRALLDSSLIQSDIVGPVMDDEDDILDTDPSTLPPPVIFENDVTPSVYIRCPACAIRPPIGMSTPARGPGRAPPGTPQGAPPPQSKSGREDRHVCPTCRSALTKCSVCMMPYGVSPQSMGESIHGEDGSGSGSAPSPLDYAYAWCQKCRHGGHVIHLKQWFETHQTCPVSKCECPCGVEDI